MIHKMGRGRKPLIARFLAGFISCKHSLGFTFAEVLITIGIIGVVSVMVFPVLIQEVQDRQYKAMWKRAFSEITQAYVSAFGADGYYVPPSGIDATVKPYSREVYYKVFSQLTNDFCVKDSPYDHECKSSNKNYVQSPPCSSLSKDKVGSCAYSGTGGYALLNDGIKIYAHAYIWSHPCMLVDVNGPKKPNVVGRDMFIVLFKERRVVPGGAPGYTLKGCNKNTASKSGFVNANSFSGSGCGYKYLYE